MLKHTTAHIPVADPTGRLPVAPSKMTTAIDKGFGLGTSAPGTLIFAEKRFPQAEIMRCLLPEKLRYCNEASAVCANMLVKPSISMLSSEYPKAIAIFRKLELLRTEINTSFLAFQSGGITLSVVAALRALLHSHLTLVHMDVSVISCQLYNL